MKCPYCSAENLENRDSCYHCGKDLAMLRVIVNRARHHYNLALEHAERQRYHEAITELNSALELDRNFINSHVVLGTIYAKMDEHDKARECWKNALALDPSIHKAHTYLEKLDLVVEVRPWVQRLRGMVAIAALIVIAMIGVIGYFILPDPALDNFDAAVAAYEQGNYQGAIDQLKTVKSTFRHRYLASIAQDYEQLINKECRLAMIHIHQLLDSSEFQAAAEQINTLSKRHPPKRYAAQLQEVRDSARRRKQELVVASLHAMREDIATSSSAITELDDYERLFSDDGTTFTQQIRAEIISIEGERAARSLIAQYEVNRPDPFATLQRIEQIQRDHPPSAELLKDLRAQVIDDMHADKLLEFQLALENQMPERVEELFQQREEWMQYLPEETARDITQNWQASLGRMKGDELLKKLDTITAQGAHTLDTLAKEAEMIIVPDQKKAALKKIDALKNKFAEEIWQHALKQDYRFQIGSPPEDIARLVADNFEFVMQNLDKNTLRWGGDYKLTLYAGSANLRLGNQEEARKLLQRVVDKWPDKVYAKFARNLLGKIN
ncbi:tetratricopeptide repeat protein [Candidatus Sumerlaeota bacterium]|nr:tetratricopeptide repeat protein [Candidatus Sumerlaeota bacterium]